MTTAAGLSVPFAPPRGDAAEDLVLLEQESWSARTGLLTRTGMVRWLDATLYGQGSADGLMHCGIGSDGNIEIVVHVYPLRPGVRFRSAATIGQLSGGEYREIEESESVSFDMTAEANLRHPALRVAAAKWLVGPYDPDGNPIDAPPLWADGRRIIAPRPLYGSVHLTVIVPRHTYRLVLPWETASALLLAGWSEFVVCLPPPGRPTALELSAPPGAAELAAGGDCGAARNRRNDDADPWPPRCLPANKHVECDYCALSCEGERAGDRGQGAG